MSTANTTPATRTDDDSITSRIEDYLASLVTDGQHYLKSREIGNELNLSAKQVAVRLPKIDDESDTVHIEKWGYSTATTWLVEPAE